MRPGAKTLGESYRPHNLLGHGNPHAQPARFKINPNAWRFALGASGWPHAGNASHATSAQEPDHAHKLHLVQPRDDHPPGADSACSRTGGQVHHRNPCDNCRNVRTQGPCMKYQNHCTLKRRRSNQGLARPNQRTSTAGALPRTTRCTGSMRGMARSPRIRVKSASTSSLPASDTGWCTVVNGGSLHVAKGMSS
jgi:hypothetical protein